MVDAREMTIFIIKTSEQSFSGLKYFYYYMISAVSLQRFIGDESQIATMHAENICFNHYELS